MYILPYKKYEEIIQDIYNHLNKKINPHIMAQQLKFSYDENTNVVASQCFGIVTVNIPALSETYGKMKFFSLCAQLVYIIAHELSHIEQDINPIKYSNDVQYRLAIETANNANALTFIFNNIDYLNSIWPDYDFEFILEDIDTIKQFNTTYKSCSYYKYIENIFDGYLFAMSRKNTLQYCKLNTIIVENYNKRVIVKQNGKTNIGIITELNNILDESCNNGYMIVPDKEYNYAPKNITITFMDDIKQVAFRV